MLKAGGRGGVVIKNTFLSNGDAKALRKMLLESCDLHTVLDMPQGTFLGAGVRTVVLFFDKGKPTKNIWYYQLDPSRSLGKNNPLNDADLAEFVELQKTKAESEKSWTVSIDAIDKDTFDLSAKNPNRAEEAALRDPKDILAEIRRLDAETAHILKKCGGVGMKNGGSFAALEEVCEFIDRRGITPEKLGSQFTSFGFRVISAKNIKKRKVDIRIGEQRFVDQITFRRWMNSPLLPDDVLLTSEAPLGEPAYIDTNLDWCLGQRLFGLRPDKARLYGRFLFYALQCELVRTDLFSRATGATAQGIRQAELRRVVIPLPPIEEQRRIVAILDEAFACIDKAKANTEKNIQNARELFDSYLNNIFSNPGPDWQTKRVGEIAKHSLGKMLDKRKNQGTMKKYLRNQTVRWFEFDLSDIGEMRFLESETGKYTAVKGDVLICEGGYPGRAAIWQQDEPIFFQKAVHRVRFHNPLHNRWLVYFLYLSDKNGNLRKSFTGAGIQHFTGEALGRFKLPIAPDDAMSEYLSALENLISKSKMLEKVFEKKLYALDEMKRTILQKAFNGGLN